MTDTNSNLTVPSDIVSIRDFDLNALKAQEIGLNILLLKIANREASRITKLASIIDKLEESIFDPILIERLPPADQIARYQLAIEATKSSTVYIKDAVKNISWNDLQNKIMILDQSMSNGNETDSKEKALKDLDLQKAAVQLLSQLGIDAIGK